MQPPEGGSTGRREEEPITRGGGEGTYWRDGEGKSTSTRDGQASEGEAEAEEGQEGSQQGQ